MNEYAGFLAALQEGTVAERRITRRIFADWLEEHGDPAEAARQRILGEEPYRNALGMEFVHLPPGTFWMGGHDGMCGTRQVTIKHDFYIGIYPVTQEEWVRVMGSNPSWFRRAGSGFADVSNVSDSELNRFPVECVNWDDCQIFMHKINHKCQENLWSYRLPTEQEWEYACRGAATTQADCSWSFYFRTPTNTLTPQLANIEESNLGRPTRVGSYPANPLGIHDMHGNVCEWCQYDDHLEPVDRGGSWKNSVHFCHAASRGNLGYLGGDNDFGLRVVRVPIG